MNAFLTLLFVSNLHLPPGTMVDASAAVPIETIWKRVQEAAVMVDPRLRDVTVVASTGPGFIAEADPAGTIRYSTMEFGNLGSTWCVAFVLGHEFGHILQHRLNLPPQGRIADELLADIVGLELTRRAGFAKHDSEHLLRLLRETGSAERLQGLAAVLHADGEIDPEKRAYQFSRLIPGLLALPPGAPVTELVTAAIRGDGSRRGGLREGGR